jgi:hypothetical protein
MPMVWHEAIGSNPGLSMFDHFPKDGFKEGIVLGGFK